MNVRGSSGQLLCHSTCCVRTWFSIEPKYCLAAQFFDIFSTAPRVIFSANGPPQKKRPGKTHGPASRLEKAAEVEA
jgi:hypothetical protein